MRRSWLSPWLARLSTSFLILCGLLLWECYKAYTGQLGRISVWRVALFLAGAFASFGLAVAGVRERHKAMHDEPPDDPPPSQ